MVIGEILTAKGDIEINKGKKAAELDVKNTGDRPIQIGSHFHFYEANERLVFDRSAAYGKRLDIPSGTAIRFQGGESKKVSLIEIGGKRKVMGANSKVNGYLSADKIKEGK